MAHQLEVVNGKASMAYSGEAPWHRLGKKVPSDLSTKQMLNAAGLNWKVKKVDTFYSHDDKLIETGQKALIRETDGKILSSVGENWHPVQNEEAFDFFNEFVNEGKMTMNTAGSLKDGQIIWALAKVEESFDLFKGKDKIESYLLFSNPHQYGKCIDIRFTPIRVVCDNTLTYSLKTNSSNAVKVNHRSQFDADEVKEIMGLASSNLSEYKEMAEFLAGKEFTIDAYKEYLMTLFPKNNVKGVNVKDFEEDGSRAAHDIYNLLETQPGAELGRGTWWQAFNSTTYYIDHIAGRNDDNRLFSSWFSYGANNKNKALHKALEYAK